MIEPLDAAFWTLAAASSAATAAVWAGVAAAASLARREPGAGSALRPMTMIKPIRGLDDELDANLESIVRCDPGARLQVVIALESEADPACAVARAFAARHPGRDVCVILTGPSGGRMGKTHNMIEALKRAKHPCVVFSDADVETTPRLLAQTSRAFDEGCEAVFALPLHRRTRGFGGLLFEAAMNHAYTPAAALSWRVGALRAAAGAWMGFTREGLERAGGLEPIAQSIAEDYALSRAVSAARLRARLLPAFVPVRETGTTPREAVVHLAKWASIICWSVPWAYALVPLVSPGALGLAALALAEACGRHVAAGAAVAALAVGSRALAAAAVDGLVGEGLAWAPRYAALAFMDVGALAFWLAGFRRRILWRGVRYRLSAGGSSRVLP